MAAGIHNGLSEMGFAVGLEASGGIGLLLERWQNAQSEDCPIWEFAVKRRYLLGAGLTEALLVQLVSAGLAAEKGNDVVLTASGFETFSGGEDVVLAVPQRIVPIYHRGLRKLTYEGRLCKQFKQRADDQEAVLKQFQKEGWVETIRNPIKPDPDIDPVEQMHSTIKRLNGCQKEARLHFFGNGTGFTICWEPGQPPGRKRR